MHLHPKSAGRNWQNIIANSGFRSEGESSYPCCYCDGEVDQDDIEESFKELSNSSQHTEGKEAR